DYAGFCHSLTSYMRARVTSRVRTRRSSMPNQSLQLNESDHELLARVRTRLELRQFRSSKSLTITTACGTVTLAGKVASSLEWQAIVLIVAHMAGVHRVIDDLAVVQPVITASKSNVGSRGRRGQV